jgi:murein DD-endopeptidase MepM/ murein hydrolase activator NlpD
MNEGQGHLKIRSFTASSFWPKLLGFFILIVLTILGGYSIYAYRTLASIKDQNLHYEIYRSEQAGKDRQVEAITERLSDLDNKLLILSQHEKELNLLTRDFNRQLGLPETSKLEELWPALISTVAWTWGGQPDQGGVDKTVSFPKKETNNPVEALRNLHRDLDRLEKSAAVIDLAFSELTTALGGSLSLLAVTPVSLPMIGGKLTSHFGYRSSPFRGGGLDLHQGIDLAAPVGTWIYAPADGTVLSADWSNNGYGLMISINHGFGLTTRYAHLSETLVTAGESVIRGQKLAKVGNTGRSTGPHLHYETLLGGVPVDPFLFAQVVEADNKSQSNSIP